MKTLQYYILAMLVLPLVALGQNPRDESAQVPPTLHIDSIRLHYPAGSVQYPSPAAFSLLQATGISKVKVIKEQGGLIQYFEGGPITRHSGKEQLLNDRRLPNRFQTNDKQLCQGGQIVIGLTFMFLSVLDTDFDIGAYDWDYWQYW